MTTKKVKKPLTFEVGGYYQHITGDCLSILTWSDTSHYGTVLLCETHDGEIVTYDAVIPDGWIRITSGEWFDNVEDSVDCERTPVSFHWSGTGLDLVLPIVVIGFIAFYLFYLG